ncbi:transmembrane protein, putative [Bodo saltans]|uniref:Transmembrane protein, putative n=1 Tax=Bodo saltans TaxID=75058 RepID=A0A0S4IMN7_BODSA|nr:transmembrane protein, putative [Bodo saltans]|eukprot:CUE73974.1 transmembrane protein, putative [Bodo saltans]
MSEVKCSSHNDGRKFMCDLGPQSNPLASLFGLSNCFRYSLFVCLFFVKYGSKPLRQCYNAAFNFADLAALFTFALGDVSQLAVMATVVCLFVCAIARSAKVRHENRNYRAPQPLEPTGNAQRCPETCEALTPPMMEFAGLLPAFLYNGEDDCFHVNIEGVLMEQRLRGVPSSTAGGNHRSSMLRASPKLPTQTIFHSSPRYNHQLKAFSCTVCEARCAETHTAASSRPKLEKKRIQAVTGSVFSHVDSDVVQRHALYCSDDHPTSSHADGDASSARRGWWPSTTTI